jgi:hypothetical protein
MLHSCVRPGEDALALGVVASLLWPDFAARRLHQAHNIIIGPLVVRVVVHDIDVQPLLDDANLPEAEAA